MFLALLFFFCASSIAADCYLRNGDVAVADNGQPYLQCPGYDFCCLGTDTCSGINGLCQDVNNHNDGSLTGDANYTGLYQTVACVNADFEGCNSQCLPVDAIREYIWACDDSLSTYCCDDGTLAQRNCCNNGQNFRLGAAIRAGSESSTSSQSATSTTSTASKTSATSTSTSATTSPATAIASSTTGSTSASATAAASSSGLSQGAKIGIGVGVAGGVLVLLIVAFIFWRRRTHHKQKGFDQPAKPAVGQMERHDIPHSNGAMYTDEVKPELHTSVSSQKPETVRMRSELSSSREPQELPGHP